MFKVGNNIRGLKDNGYFGADEKMIEALVIYTNDKIETMGIKILSHTDETQIGICKDVENNKLKFELL